MNAWAVVILFINSMLLVYGVLLLRSALLDLKARVDLSSRKVTDIRSKVYDNQDNREMLEDCLKVVREIREETSKIAPKRRTTKGKA